MHKLLKDMITQADGESFCAFRILAILGALAFVLLSYYAITKGSAFSPQDWGIGYGSLVGGSAGGVWAKSKAEPEQ